MKLSSNNEESQKKCLRSIINAVCNIFRSRGRAMLLLVDAPELMAIQFNPINEFTRAQAPESQHRPE